MTIQSESTYVEESVLVKLFGTKGRARILDVFLSKHDSEMTIQEIADWAGIAVSTVHRNIDELIEFGVIRPSRAVENTQLYHLNKGSPLTKTIGEFHSDLIDHVEEVNNQQQTLQDADTYIGDTKRDPQSGILLTEYESFNRHGGAGKQVTIEPQDDFNREVEYV